MHTTKLFSMRKVHKPFKPALKYLQEQMVLRLWTPSIGQRTNQSTRDDNCGQKRLDSPLMPWREIQRKPRFLTSIIGSMDREWDTLSHGKTARPSSASQHMMNQKTKKASTLQNVQKVTLHCLNFCQPPSQIHCQLSKNYTLPSKALFHSHIV